MLPVIIKGRVTHGRKIASAFNMPTANITPTRGVSDLKYGVYYSKVLIDGNIYKGITNLGKKPTVNASNASVNTETFIYDFDGDLYGKELTLTLLDFRRPERKFESVELLMEEIGRDVEAGRAY